MSEFYLHRVSHVKSVLKWIVASVLLSILFTGCRSSGSAMIDGEREEKMPRSVDFDHTHKDFDRLLKLHVTDGWVDYPGFIADTNVLSDYTGMLGAITEGELHSWSREQQLAYWVNAYNAFTIKAIIERYPIRERSLIGLFFPRNSILQISGIWSRLAFSAGGRSLTLGAIEHDILRKEFSEPRIHFAIVCASRSCPKLRAEAYRHDILDNQFHDQAVDFINDPYRGIRWEKTSGRIYISKIFKWFKNDFTSHRASDSGNSLLDYIRPYIADASVQDAMSRKEKIRTAYLPYDWRLNERHPPNP